MTFADFCRLIATPTLDLDALFCIQYLEERGQRFCVDFGYENAIQVLAELENETA